MQVKELLTSTESDLAKLGSSGELNELEKMKTLTEIILKFARQFSAQVEGQRRQEINTKSPSGSARLTHILWNNLRQSLNTLDPIQSISDADILIATANVGQVAQHLFNPEVR